MSMQEPIRQPEERNWAIAVWLLYLGSYITVITIIAGSGHRLHEALAIRRHALRIAHDIGDPHVLDQHYCRR